MLTLVLTIFVFTGTVKAQVDTSVKAQVDIAVGMIKSGRNMTAAQKLLDILNNNAIPSARPRIKYLFGLALLELNLNQVAAFQFVDVVRSGDVNWTKPALEKLLIVTDKMGDETLLNFALQRIQIDQFPAANREMIYYHLAETKHKLGNQEEAISFYRKVSSKSRYYYNALYNMGLAQDELGKTDDALQSFKRLLASRASAKPNDTNKVSAIMAIARTYYQKKDWSKAIEVYSKVPRDHVLWHAALFEKTWAMLRSARFRSTLSNFQSLHSSYYDDAYLPETLLLRAIVYLYICQYDEMEKVLSLFNKEYGSALKTVTAFLQKSENDDYYREIYNAIQTKNGSDVKRKTEIPYNILKFIASEGDVRRSYSYLKKINDEKRRLDQDSTLRSSSVGEYSNRILTNRINSTKLAIGGMVKRYLTDIKNELNDLTEQAGFIRYEMLNGRKELLKRKIEGKGVKVELAKDERQDREFYIQNGYEYYPFQGEYWLDEIGNYHYLGRQSCE
jgi:tetratricopeptide (TPR) repeat protein